MSTTLTIDVGDRQIHEVSEKILAPGSRGKLVTVRNSQYRHKIGFDPSLGLQILNGVGTVTI